MQNNSAILNRHEAKYAIPIANPDYMMSFSFEKYDYLSWYKWMEGNWQVSIHMGLVYLFMITLAQNWMKTRKQFTLRVPLLIWNISLSAFSLYIFLRMRLEGLEELKTRSFYDVACNVKGHTLPSSFNNLLFILSKPLEFGDTLFLILAKKKLIFLHYYHHFTVVIYSFYSFHGFDAANRIFGPVNAFIHFFMYGYFAMRAAGVKVPKIITMGITAMQIGQMGLCLILSGMTFIGKYLWDDCDRTWNRIIWSSAMYLSYLVLFGNFFAKAYFARRKEGKKND